MLRQFPLCLIWRFNLHHHRYQSFLLLQRSGIKCKPIAIMEYTHSNFTTSLRYVSIIPLYYFLLCTTVTCKAIINHNNNTATMKSIKIRKICSIFSRRTELLFLSPVERRTVLYAFFVFCRANFRRQNRKSKMMMDDVIAMENVIFFFYNYTANLIVTEAFCVLFKGMKQSISKTKMIKLRGKNKRESL